ncbi:putative DEP domain, RGS domain, RGS domain superfamily, winged helix DNA-binding domain superfamily [Septoria linicola]|nr:putative DEP domain, RGS domain, RGS domain superfamily, winged helix DNA-binding domain superfamily [Septoria linicola]
MTGDDQPYTRDFKDLFATLIVSLPLTAHRVRFTKYPHTFTTEEAITNLGSLKFSQSNRMPDPKAPDRIVTTTTTTTFSMAREMARATCARFLEARIIESVDGRTDFSSRSSVWQLTPKGMHILHRFCQRNGIHQRHVNELLDSPRNGMNLVILERDPETDEIMHDSDTVNVLFRRFAGDSGPNVKAEGASSDSDSMNESPNGLTGVKMERAKSTRKDQRAHYVFTGKHAFDWLMDCTTTVNKREGFTLANLFLQIGLIEPFGADQQNAARFAASRHVKYAVTLKGMQVAGWVPTPATSSHGESATNAARPTAANVPVRDSNTNRMTVIIRDPALRLLFREYLRETHCEENLSFYTEVKAFLDDYQRAKRGSPTPRPDVIRETLASAYSLYNAFLAPGSPCELNIDHNLRNALAARMTRAVGEDEQMIRSLDEVADLFDQAQSSVFKLMASDSVPKFFREPKYAAVLRERNLENMISRFTATSVSG